MWRNYFLVTTGTWFSSVTFVNFCTHICLIAKVCRCLQCPSRNIHWHTETLRHVSDTWWLYFKLSDTIDKEPRHNHIERLWMAAAAIRLYPAVCVFIIPKTEAFNAHCLLWVWRGYCRMTYRVYIFISNVRAFSPGTDGCNLWNWYSLTWSHSSLRVNKTSRRILCHFVNTGCLENPGRLSQYLTILWIGLLWFFFP